MRNENKHDLHTIPPNFIEGGTLFGGMFKIRNVIEAGIVVGAIGIPVLSLDLSLTMRIIILCLTALPLGLFALMGFSGESLSSFLIGIFKFLKNRRVISRDSLQKKKQHKQSAESPFINPVAEYLPIDKIQNGIIYTKDHRYLKVIEVIPINFLLRSAREQKNIIYSFISYLKISPVKIQFKVLTKRADLNKHTDIVRREMGRETDPNCRMLQEDYLDLVAHIGSREATTRRFFVIFEYEQLGRRGASEESDAISSLQIAARTAVSYLKQCGNEVLIPENEDEFTVDVLYSILRRQTSADVPLPQRVQDVVAQYVAAQKDTNNIPCCEFFSPDRLDFTHSRYICIDGLYHTYLLVPSNGYKAQVPAGWLSLLVNAGDGIDIDLFLEKQPKERMVQKLGQQLRINRSKIKETSDTNSDFDDLEGAIRSGYFLKDGMANNEEKR